MRTAERVVSDAKSSRVHAVLKAEIISCTLHPGQVINEAEVAERLATSKTPVRQALSRLELEGFVQILPRRGTLVGTVSVRDVQHVYLMRRLLEPEASAMAARRATPQDVEHLRALESRAQAAREHNDLTPGGLLHAAIADLSGVPRLATALHELHEHVQWFLKVQAFHGEPISSDYDHNQLLDAIEARDSAGARKISELSIARSIELIMASIARQGVESTVT